MLPWTINKSNTAQYKKTLTVVFFLIMTESHPGQKVIREGFCTSLS